MTTNVAIDADLHGKVRLEAAKASRPGKRITIRRWVEDAIRDLNVD